MDKIQKLLKSLNQKQRQAMLNLMIQIEKDHNKVPGIRKLTNKENLYRVRFGNYRIIFRITNNQSEIIRIGKQDESTYK